MKKIISLLLILCAACFVVAQEIRQKPLTQAEYVKLLYELQKTPGKKDELVEAIRRRGIAFELTDGLRGLTASKSKSDADLRRTLEEAARRKADPEQAKLPSEKESAAVLAKAREATLTAVEEMPDFVVKQQIARSAAYAGTNNFRHLDRLVVAVSYRSEGREEYRVLSRNGILETNPQSKQSYEEVGGTSSTGEFVTVLAKIFKPDSDTKFELVDTDVVRTRRALVYDYSIVRDKAKQVIVAAGAFDDTAVTGMKGRIWIDRENFRVLRVETAATEIPDGFRIRAASRTIDYDWVTIADEKYLLPLLSDVRLTSKQDREMYETRNVIRFKDYQKFGSEVKIVDDDEEVPEEKPQN